MSSSTSLDFGLTRSIPDGADEVDLLCAQLPLDGARVLELGCGRAATSRALTERADLRELLALEVDETQHALNAASRPAAPLRFGLGGAEAIPADDATFDVVLMLKSLHHVPVDRLDKALAEVARVLRPGGLAWISEPLYRDGYNEVLRLFHDEQAVRRAAFDAVVRAVDAGRFESVSQTFFRRERRFDDFAQFEREVIGVTHTRHELSPEQLERVRARFGDFADDDGSATFDAPIRVDLLRRPLGGP